jgi:hypothetical protein
MRSISFFVIFAVPQVNVSAKSPAVVATQAVQQWRKQDDFYAFALC